MTKKSDAPAIRFKGFSDAWEQRKLGECFSERVESMPDGELISVTINDGIKKFSELGRHDNSNDNKSKYKKVCVGDIAYNSMRMWQGASGYSPYEGIVSPAYTVLSPNAGVFSRCIAYQFKLPQMIHTFQINSQGITSDNWNLKYPTLSEIEIYISKNVAEQKQIAEFFTSLDNLITLHQRKFEKLTNVKKSMLEKMFPQNGSSYPEIRFKGFTDPWEQRKVGNLLIERNQQAPMSDEYPLMAFIANDLAEIEVAAPSDESEAQRIGTIFRSIDNLITLHQRKCISFTGRAGRLISTVNKKRITSSWEQRKVSELFRVTRGYVLAATQTETTKTDEKPYPVYSSQTKDKGLMGYYKDYLYEDAITWTTDGANAGTVNYRAGKFYCTNVCGVLLSNEVKANQMIAEALNSVAKGYVSYVGNPKLMNNVMADIVIQIPTQAEEREQLSSFFAKLDKLITLHQRKPFLMKWRNSDANRNQTNRLVL